MNYKKLYDILYSEGYHISKLKNMGIIFVDYICEHFIFDSILDIGCSQGLVVQEYACHYNKCAFGIDVSEVAIKKAIELGVKNCFVANVIEIPFTDNFFDAIVTCDVLEHLEKKDLDQAINEMIRVTRNLLFIKVATGVEKNRGWIELLKKKYSEYKDLDNLHLTTMDLDKWIELFEKTGKVKLLQMNKDLNNIMIFEVIK